MRTSSVSAQLSKLRIESPVMARAMAVAFVACVALAGRLYQIGDHSLWFDEALEFQRAAQPLIDTIRARGIDQDPPLYALGVHYWMRVASHEAWLRMPSALFGAATAAVLCGWAWGRFGSFAATLAGLLAAVAPVLVFYGQELNQYALVALFSVVLLVAYERVVDIGTAADWALYMTASAAAMLTHYGMLFPLLVLGAGLLLNWRRRGGPGLGRMLIVYVCVMALTAAVMWWLGLREGLAVSHVQRRFGGTHLQKEIDYIKDVGWREVLVFYLLPFSGGPPLWIVRVLSLVALVGSVAMWRRCLSGRRVVALFFAPLALTYLTSIMGWYPLGYRYGLFVAPWLLLAIAVAVGALQRFSRPVGWLGAVAVLVSLALFVPQNATENQWLNVPREDIRPIAEYVRSERDPGDAVYAYYGALPAIGYYLRDDEDRVLDGRYLSHDSWEGELARVRAAAEIDGRVWLVLSHVTPGDGTAILSSLTSPRGGVRGLRVVDSVRSEGASAYALEP